MVANRLDREGLALDDDIALDFLGRDLGEVFALEERLDVVAQVRGDRQAMGLLAPAQLQRLAEFGARLLHRRAAGGCGNHRFALAQPRELLSACAFVSPSLAPVVRTVPIRRLTRRSSGPYQEPIQDWPTWRSEPVP